LKHGRGNISRNASTVVWIHVNSILFYFRSL
jgi:hypothetical protein